MSKDKTFIYKRPPKLKTTHRKVKVLNVFTKVVYEFIRGLLRRPSGEITYGVYLSIKGRFKESLKSVYRKKSYRLFFYSQPINLKVYFGGVSGTTVITDEKQSRITDYQFISKKLFQRVYRTYGPTEPEKKKKRTSYVVVSSSSSVILWTLDRTT